jgi:LacI family transcriptional regulator
MGADQIGRPVTMADIARDLGISKVAVSKALAGHSDISQATRERVAQRAREVGYVPNTTWRTLRFQRSHLIGVVVPSVFDSFFSEMLEGVSSVLDGTGYQAILTVSSEKAEREVREIQTLMSRQVEGLIIASCQRQDGLGVFERIRKRSLPFVLADRSVHRVESCLVGVDNFAVGKLVTEHLLGCGRTRIAHLCGPTTSPGILRARGYEAAMTAAGFEVRSGYVAGGGETREAVAPAVRALLKRMDRPDAIFAYNDLAAVEALRVIAAAGLRVPDDIALAGVGNNRYSDVLASPLTTVDQNPQLMGERVAKLLLQWLTTRQKPETREFLLPVRLIVRESSVGKHATMENHFETGALAR